MNGGTDVTGREGVDRQCTRTCPYLICTYFLALSSTWAVCVTLN